MLATAAAAVVVAPTRAIGRCHEGLPAGNSTTDEPNPRRPECTLLRSALLLLTLMDPLPGKDMKLQSYRRLEMMVIALCSRTFLPIPSGPCAWLCHGDVMLMSSHNKHFCVAATASPWSELPGQSATRRLVPASWRFGMRCEKR